jgi:PAS domain-containing protein
MMSLAVDPDFFLLLSGAHQRLVGKPLMTHTGDAAAGALWLFEAAPFCVLAHNTDADPLFIYANRSAQDCFGYDWDEIVQLPSRLSAEAPDRVERQRLLDAVAVHGFISNYRGLRIAKSGRRFWIENATVWQLIDDAGRLHGQAAMFQKPSV